MFYHYVSSQNTIFSPKEEKKHNDQEKSEAKIPLQRKISKFEKRPPLTVSAVLSPRKDVSICSDNEVKIPIIEAEQIQHLKERVKLAVMTFEEKLNTFLFDKIEIKMEDFMDKCEQYFLLGKGDTIQLTRYLFERRNKPKVVYQK